MTPTLLPSLNLTPSYFRASPQAGFTPATFPSRNFEDSRQSHLLDHIAIASITSQDDEANCQVVSVSLVFVLMVGILRYGPLPLRWFALAAPAR
jgi:hypothetical protein